MSVLVKVKDLLVCVDENYVAEIIENYVHSYHIQHRLLTLYLLFNTLYSKKETNHITTMKFNFLTIQLGCLLLLGFHCQAQFFPIDSTSKKILYTNVEIIDSVPTAQLYKNAEMWMSKNFKSPTNYDTQFNLKEGFIKCNTSYLVYTKGMMSKEIHGRISYDIMIEIKEKKYRYTFTNFVFEYYKQNRQYQYEPTGRIKPLEEPKYPGWQPVWNKHKIQANNTVQQLIVSLKLAMKQTQFVEEKKMEKKKTEW